MSVLNVIEHKKDRIAVLKEAHELLSSNPNGGVVIIKIWEGTSTGIASRSPAFQANRKTAFYLDEVKSVFGNAVLEKDSFLIHASVVR
jgi:hypothetical protein